MDKAALHAAREIEKCPDARKLGDAVEKSKRARHATSIIHDLAEEKRLFDWLWPTIVLYRHTPKPHSLSYRPQAPRFPTTTTWYVPEALRPPHSTAAISTQLSPASNAHITAAINWVQRNVRVLFSKE
jgi:hypothetical protein